MSNNSNKEQRKNHLLRFNQLAKAKKLYIPYKSSRIERKILSWFGIFASGMIANKLKINRSYVYAVIEKYKHIYTKEEIIKGNKKWK